MQEQPKYLVAENFEERRLHHFRALDHDEQAAAIRRMAATGSGDETIARATGLSVEMIRRIVADAAPGPLEVPVE